jgi:hypothetical protein
MKKGGYNKFAGVNRRKSDFISKWAEKEGVFQGDDGRWIVRVYKSKGCVTSISRHESKEEADIAYSNYYDKSK